MPLSLTRIRLNHKSRLPLEDLPDVHSWGSGNSGTPVSVAALPLESLPALLGSLKKQGP